jgi:hypothetical protein
MTDIVARLLDRSYMSKAKDPLCEEAAAEIERLKQRVAELAYAKEQLELRVLDLIMTRAKNAMVTGNAQGPFAWAADIPGKFGAAPTVLFGYTEKLVRSIAAAGGDVVQPFPLYRQPALTNEERQAVGWYAAFGKGDHAKTLRGLLERLHPAASGYTRGISASKETKEESRWISTADQMPGHIEEVLMYFGDDSDQQVVRTGYYDTGEDSDRSNGLTVADLRGWWVHTGSDESEKIDESEAPPTHWMLCPGPPDE